MLAVACRVVNGVHLTIHLLEVLDPVFKEFDKPFGFMGWCRLGFPGVTCEGGVELPQGDVLLYDQGKFTCSQQVEITDV